MSPEQVQGHTVDVRSDLYSLGVSMYHLLAGRPPFEADDALALAVMHLHETPMPLDRARGASDLPESLIAIVSRLMSKSPSDRFQSPRELLDSLRGEHSGPAYVGVGTAAATIRLQRITQEQSRLRRRQRLRWATAVLLPLVIGSIAAFAVAERTPSSVGQVLRPDRVPMAETVEGQYLIGAMQDDPPGWTAVGEYYPPEQSAINAEYFAKAMLQLARNYHEAEDLEAADRVLEQLLNHPQVDRLYQALAMVQRCNVQKEMGGGAALTQSRTQLRTLYTDLQNNYPAQAAIFDDVVSEKDRLELGLDSMRATS